MLSNTISYIKGFFLRAKKEVKTRVIKTIKTIRFNYKKSFKTKTTLKGLSNTISYIKDFFLKTGIKVVIRVFKTIKITGVLKIIGAIIGAIKIRATSNIRVRASLSCIKYSKIVL